METRPSGERVALQDGDAIYLAGDGASETGDRPFLDRFSLATLKKERLFRCDEGRSERFLAFAGTSRAQALVRSESKTDPPNLYVVDLASGARRKLTDYRDPTPELTRVTKELVKYARKDGVPLSGTLYLPPGIHPGHAPPRARVGLPARVLGHRDRRPGARLHEHLPPRHRRLAARLPDPGLRRAHGRDHAGRGRPGDDERHLRRADHPGGRGRDRRRSTRRASWTGAASSWAATATAPS